jgi:nucleotide-binding universal stress UspA family protein
MALTGRPAQEHRQGMTHQVNARRIVVGVDGSEASKCALRWAVTQAELTQATIEVVGVWEYPAAYTWGALPAIDAVTLADACEQMLDRTITEILGDSPTVHVEPYIVTGHPAYELVTQAKGADLLVVGSRGHGGFVGALLGSVSQYCVHHATCPVVVVRGECVDRRP